MPRTHLALLCAVALALFALGGIAVNAADPDVPGQGDTEPPHLVWLEIEPTLIDTTNGPQSISITAHVTDDLSGFQRVQASFILVKDSQPAPVHVNGRIHSISPITGTINDGVFEGAILLPQFLAEGRYYLSNLYITDQVENTCVWSRSFDEPTEPKCGYNGKDIYFINVTDTGPPSTATPTPTPTPTATPDHIATAVVATLTAIAMEVTPIPASTPAPCVIRLPAISQ